MFRLGALVLVSLVTTTAAAADIGRAQSAAPLVGTWRRSTTCNELVAALRSAGMQKWIREFVAGNGFVPGVTSSARISATTPCKGAVARVHSHFFTPAREFGSLDWKGRPVDDGHYRVVDRRTFVISKEFPSVTFRYAIDGGRIRFTPLVPHGCTTFRCAWAISMAYPGKTWQRVR